jgi:hypothetical protein
LWLQLQWKLTISSCFLTRHKKNKSGDSPIWATVFLNVLSQKSRRLVVEVPLFQSTKDLPKGPYLWPDFTGEFLLGSLLQGDSLCWSIGK